MQVENVVVRHAGGVLDHRDGARSRSGSRSGICSWLCVARRSPHFSDSSFTTTHNRVNSSIFSVPAALPREFSRRRHVLVEVAVGAGRTAAIPPPSPGVVDRVRLVSCVLSPYCTPVFSLARSGRLPAICNLPIALGPRSRSRSLKRRREWKTIAYGSAPRPDVSSPDVETRSSRSAFPFPFSPPIFAMDFFRSAAPAPHWMFAAPRCTAGDLHPQGAECTKPIPEPIRVDLPRKSYARAACFARSRAALR